MQHSPPAPVGAGKLVIWTVDAMNLLVGNRTLTPTWQHVTGNPLLAPPKLALSFFSTIELSPIHGIWAKSTLFSIFNKIILVHPEFWALVGKVLFCLKPQKMVILLF